MSTQYTGVILSDRAYAYYRAGEPSGLVAYDVSGNGLHGAISASGITYSQAGAITLDPDKSLLFDAIAGAIALPSGAKPDGFSAFSVECWFNLTTATFAGQERLVSEDATSTNSKGFDLRLAANAASISFVVGNGTTNAIATWTNAFTAGVWHHVVGTWDGTTITLYVDGTSRATASLSGTIGASTHVPQIGRAGGTATNFFGGLLDEVALYNYALTSVQVGSHFTTAGAVATLLYSIPTNTKTAVCQATDINQILNVLQQPTGGQEKGHYFLEEPCFTAGATASDYIPHLSSVSVPVSVTLDASDLAQVGLTAAIPSTSTLKPAGFQVFGAAATGPQNNARVGGNYTTQF